MARAGYYTEHLAADRLQRCYELAPPRVRQYFGAEAAFVASRLRSTDTVLELGCGYGRVMKELAPKARLVFGIDTSASSLQFGAEFLRDVPNCRLLQMDAFALGFRDHTFDVVVCIQNGLSAFHLDPQIVVRECVRVTRSGGLVLLSTYAAKFWPHRLEWFRLQAAQGLLGEIDEDATRDGRIVCKDGFTARTITPDEFLSLTSGLAVQRCTLTEVDESSLFCEIVV